MGRQKLSSKQAHHTVHWLRLRLSKCSLEACAAVQLQAIAMAINAIGRSSLFQMKHFS